jgi:4-alpha-glucanotransferase
VPRTGIQSHYIDALGRRHRPPASTLAKIEAAMDAGPSTGGDVVVVREGERPRIGPAEIRLEDGATRVVDRRLPPDLPAGYHQIKRKGEPAARLIVAPCHCYMPPDLRGWGWAIQLYASRSRGSWGIGDLADLRRLGRWGKRVDASF